MHFTASRGGECNVCQVFRMCEPKTDEDSEQQCTMIIQFYQSIFSQMKFNVELQNISFQVFIERYLFWISTQFSPAPWGPELSGWWTSQYLEMNTKCSAKDLNQYYNIINTADILWVVLPVHVIMRSHTNDIAYK